MDATLDVVRRDRFGKNEAGRIRQEGRIPAVVYGPTGGKGAMIDSFIGLLG